ncbi:MAG: hypothetical protein KAJ63_07815 [Methyloprofundus sp.]|nr:hypothetical protein [Methyloprofundus sp.]
MSSRPLPNPKRLRRIPSQFSWIDHRLVREGYFEQCSCDALALYLFLLTVADARGLSYYSQPLLMKQLKFGTVRFSQARSELIENRLIAYQHPLYQVLALGANAEQKPNLVVECNSKSTSAPMAIKKILQQLSVTRRSHD